MRGMRMGLGFRRGSVPGGGGGGGGTDANVTLIGADGWTITHSAPGGTLGNLVVTRAGFDATGTATTYSETVPLTGRIRLPFPDQATLTSDKVRAARLVYAADTVESVTNNSTRVAPKPVVNWAMFQGETVGNTLSWEVVAAHVDGQQGEFLRAFKAIASDGTNTVTQTVTTSSISTNPTDKTPVVVYAGTLDISSLNDDARITLDGEAYPWFGTSASVAKSVDSTVVREFSTREFYRSTSRLAAPQIAYVSTTGNNTTAIVSTNDAAARALPFADITRATVALNGNGMIKLEAGSFPLGTPTTAERNAITAAQNAAPGAVIITRAADVARADAVVTFGTTANATHGHKYLQLKDVTITRTNTQLIAGSVFFKDADYNGGGFSGQISTGGLSIDGLNTTATVSGGLNPGTGEIRMVRGMNFAAGAGVEGWLFIGNLSTGSMLFQEAAGGTKPPNGAFIGYNRMFNHTNNSVSMVNIGAGSDVSGFAFVQNVAEYIATGAVAIVRISPDAATKNNHNVILAHNTFTGFDTSGRWNVFYDEGATPRTSLQMLVIGNIATSINTKSDVFRGANELDATAGTRIGNWEFENAVNCPYNFSMYMDADGGGLGSAFAQDYFGLGANYGTSRTVRNDPLFVDYKGTVSGSVAGAGNGNYALQSGSPAKAMVLRPVLKFDITGASRSLSAASAGAFE